jgi:hypothetical protein
MLRVMYKNAGQDIILAIILATMTMLHRMTMTPSTGHKWFDELENYVNNIPCICHQISTQMNTYRRYWSVA